MKSANRASSPDAKPNPGPKSGPEEDSSGSEHSGNPAPKPGSSKGANGADPAPAKSNPAPVVVAVDPTPVADPPIMLKTAEAPADQPHPTPEPAVPVEVFALPEPAASSASVAAGIPVTPQTESSQDNTQAPADPGNLVFHLSLSPSEAAPKAQIPPAEQAEEAAFQSGEEVPSTPQTHTGASDSDAKNQDQQEQPTPLTQLSSIGTDGTIASQFGFQTPLSFAAQIAAPKAEITPTAAYTRTAENVSTPDLPMAPSVDRVGLTIQGADNQVVRVEINQSGELVQVGVRTGNSDLANELRGSVPELVRRLDQQGYESRVSMPSSAYASLAPAVMAGAHSEFRSGADSNNGNAKSNGSAAPQEEPRQQRQRNPQRTWRELASQLQED
jgi:hypothetical protein